MSGTCPHHSRAGPCSGCGGLWGVLPTPREGGHIFGVFLPSGGQEKPALSPPHWQIPSLPTSPLPTLFMGTYRSPSPCPNTGQGRPADPGHAAWGCTTGARVLCSFSEAGTVAPRPRGHIAVRRPPHPSALPPQGHWALSCQSTSSRQRRVRLMADSDALGSGGPGRTAVLGPSSR